MEETGFVFSLMEILQSVLLYCYTGLWGGFLNNPILFPSSFALSAGTEQEADSPPAQGNARRGKSANAQHGKHSLQSLLAAGREAECLPASETAKQSKETRQAFLSAGLLLLLANLLPASTAMQAHCCLGSPQVWLHLADQPLASVGYIVSFFFLPGSSMFWTTRNQEY